MAFTNTRKVDLGGGLMAIFGDFTQSAGGGSQTYAVGAGRILLVQVNPQGSVEPVDVETNLYSVSISGAINTLTIYGNSSITAGTFLVILNTGG